MQLIKNYYILCNFDLLEEAELENKKKAKHNKRVGSRRGDAVTVH